MPTGTVKWFNNAKGFGFILSENGGDDLFAHYSSIEMEGYKTLKAGQTVTFDVSDTDKGSHAKNIRILINTENEATTQAHSVSNVTQHTASLKTLENQESMASMQAQSA